MRLTRIVAVGSALIGTIAFATPAFAAPAPFGRTCTPQNGVRFCGGDVNSRVPTFDGVPIDVDVTLPPSGDGPFPAIVMMHGYGGNKGNFETTSPDGDGSNLYHWNNVWFAQQGYAVLNYSARGFGNSCGAAASRTAPGCAQGWIHLDDQRFEARDAQHLLGLLADQGVVQPTKIGVTGISYGGGFSMELAFLRNRIRLGPSQGSAFAPWTSPAGKPMEIAAAYPRWPWSDLVYSLEPNGRFLDFEAPGERDSRTPIGVAKNTYISGLYATGNTSGYYAPIGVDPNADITGWFARVQRGEPEDAEAKAIADQIFNFHGGFGIPGTPAPLLIQNGWTDDLFPVIEALRVYNHVGTSSPVTLQLADLGHMRGSNKRNANRAFLAEGAEFFDAYLKGSGNAPAARSVTAFTQTCPRSVDAGGPYRAASWPEIHPGAVSFGDEATKRITSGGGTAATGNAIDPVIGGGDACRSIDEETGPGTAVYTGPESKDFTLLGLPTVTARIDTNGAGGQIGARLWDVSSDGKQTLVSRGVYRLLDDQKGQITFQLFGNGWRFVPGHRPKLELLGRDAPYLRPSNGSFSVAVSDVRVELPTLEKPGGQVGTRAAGCLSRRLRIGTRGIGRFRLGARRSTIAAVPTRSRRTSMRFCVAGGGELVVAFGRRGDIRLIGSTAPGHRLRGVGPRSRLSAVRRKFKSLRPLGRGLYRVSGGSRLVVFGVRRGRVRFVALTGRRQIKSLGQLRFYLKRASLR